MSSTASGTPAGICRPNHRSRLHIIGSESENHSRCIRHPCSRRWMSDSMPRFASTVPTIRNGNGHEPSIARARSSTGPVVYPILKNVLPTAHSMYSVPAGSSTFRTSGGKYAPKHSASLSIAAVSQDGPSVSTTVCLGRFITSSAPMHTPPPEEPPAEGDHAHRRDRPHPVRHHLV